ncbi:hypothetical protein G5C51_20050 [Streptomyces sp. A7024]|uniref:Antibiotic biosynthesis protein n=1 Tax=Streptomyces coryli TaxID=1128680 RepID=A0A6G4U479_9ACTN|nr:LmbU family transcriptional regulator [Streptomyces coryli]NGN66178.1 hypothetical protein [Streptomyces coryli]
MIGVSGRTVLNGQPATRRTALSLPEDLPLAEWRHLGRQILVIVDSSAWWLGDWLVYGQLNYPDRYRRALAETSLDYQTLRNYAWVVRKFPAHRRRKDLSFQHHAEVAGMPEEEQDAWLDRAEQGNWTRNELRKRVRAQRQAPAALAEKAVLVQVNIMQTRRVQWQKAAEAAGLDLQEWIVQMLDEAAIGM